MLRRSLCALALVAFATVPALADPKSDLLASLGQFTRTTSYHITATGTRGPAVEADMMLPAKMHVTAGPMEMIKIDATTWVKMNGKWQKFALPGIEQMTAGISNAVSTARTSPDDMVVTDLGMKSPDGVPMHAYTVTNKAGKSPSTLFIDSSGRLARVEGTDGTVVKFSKFNAIDPIEPPL